MREIIFDTETTGLDNKLDRVIEIGGGRDGKVGLWCRQSPALASRSRRRTGGERAGGGRDGV